MALRGRADPLCLINVVTVCTIVFKTVCFVFVHPGHGGRGRRRGVHRGLRINSRVLAVNNVCNHMVSLGRSDVVVRSGTSRDGVAVTH